MPAMVGSGRFGLSIICGYNIEKGAFTYDNIIIIIYYNVRDTELYEKCSRKRVSVIFSINYSSIFIKKII